MSFGDILQKLRKHRDLKQEYVAEQIGVKKNTISNYENNVSKPHYEQLVKLCNLFKVDPNYLMQEDVIIKTSKPNPEDQYIIDHYKSLTPHDKEIVDHIFNMKPEESTKIYLLPVYEQDVAAGPGQLGFDQKHTMEEFYESDMPEKVSYGIHIKGTSMETNEENDIPDRSIVLVSTEFDYDDLNSEAVVANIGGVLVCKEYNIAEDGHLWLKSRNPDKSAEDRHIYDIDRVKIIGRVVKVVTS